MRESVVVTGMGVMTPLGTSPGTLWAALLAKETAARSWHDLAGEGFRQDIACRITSLRCDPLERGKKMTQHCIDQAILQAAVTLPRDTGVYLGSTMGESAAFELGASDDTVDLSQYTCGALARGIQSRYALTGPCLAFGTACAAGNYALNAAALALRRHEVDVAIAGGVDPFSRIAMAGFSRSRAMSSDGLCRPFDVKHNGMVLGEGAAFFILERASDACARGIKPLARIGAMGMTCDAHHPTAPDPSGQWIELSIRQALDEEHITPQEINWICAHGSGTVPSDKAESQVLSSVFQGSGAVVSGIKGGTGHTLGAATAIEAAVCMLSLEHQMIPPTVGCDAPMESMGIEVICDTRPSQISWILNCGYAFGGLNTALLIGSWN